MATKKEKLMGGINSLIGTIGQPTPSKPAPAEEIPMETISKVVKERQRLGGRPRSNFRKITKASQEGCKENEVRATFIVNEALLEEFKQIAWRKRLKVKDAADMMLQEFIQAHSKEKE